MSKRKHEWTRKGVTASMAVVLAFGMVPAVPGVALANGEDDQQDQPSVEQTQEDQKEVGSFDELSQALQNAEKGDVIIVTNTITLDSDQTIKGVEGVVLVPKAGVAYNAENTPAMFCLNGGSKLENVEVSLESWTGGELNVAYMKSGSVMTGCTMKGAEETSNPVTRAALVAGGATAIEISDNEFSNFFASAYLNNTADDGVEGTKSVISGNVSTNCLNDWCISWESVDIEISNNKGDSVMKFFDGGFTGGNQIDFSEISSSNPESTIFVNQDDVRALLKNGSYQVGSSVTNEGQTYGLALESALAYADDGDVIEFAQGKYIAPAGKITKRVSLVAADGASVTIEGPVTFLLKGDQNSSNLAIRGIDFVSSGDEVGVTGLEFTSQNGNELKNLTVSVDDCSFAGWQFGLGAYSHCNGLNLVVSNTVFETWTGVCFNRQNELFESGTEGYVSANTLTFGEGNAVFGEYAVQEFNNVNDGVNKVDWYYPTVEDYKNPTEENRVHYSKVVAGYSVVNKDQFDAALAKAADGAAICVSGTLDGGVTVDKDIEDLTIKGTKSGKITSGSLTTSSNVDVPGLSIVDLAFENANIQMSPSADADHSGMTVSGNTFDGAYGEGLSAIHLNFGSLSGTNSGAPYDNLRITGNVISNIKSGTSSGIWVKADGVTESNVTVRDNVIDGTGWNGIQLNSVEGESILVEGNTIKNCAASGDDGLLNFYGTEAETFGVNRNVLYPDSGQLAVSYVSDDIDMKLNYWGSVAPSFEELIGYNGGSEGKKVDVEPFYVRDTMEDSDLNTYAPPSTGGGSGSVDKDEVVVENPDGSTTTTVTEDDGTSVETTVSEDEGVTTVVEKDKDGAVTSVSATVTEEAVEAAGGKAVALPFAEPIEAASSEKAVEVKVEAPAGAKVAVPVAKAEGADSVAPGAVLVLVDAEGNETVLPKTANDGSSLSAEIPGDCTLKVVDASASFPDVASDDWYEEQGVADFVSARGIMTGVEVAPGSFEFQGDVATNRGMFVTMLHRLESEPAAGSEGFADVPEGSWYEDSSAWAVEAGIATGYLDAEGNATFDGEGKVTREQMATFLFRYAQWLKMDTSARAEQEIEGVSDFAKDAVSWAVAEGLIKGDDTTGAIRPGDGATRAEAAAVVMRMVDLMA